MYKNETEARTHAQIAFKNHVATIRVNTNDIVVIEWGNKDGSSNYYMQFIIDKKRGALIISGDLGDCISSWYNALEINDLVRYVQNVSYWMGKFQTSSDSYSYDWEDVKSDLEKIKTDYLENMDDYSWDKDKDEIETDFDNIAYELEYNWTGGEPYPQDAIDIIEEYDCDWWEGDWSDLGERIDSRVFIWSEGLRLAYKQLKPELEVKTI